MFSALNSHSLIKNMVIFTKGASITSHGSSMKYGSQFVYQPWVKDTSLWIVFLAQLFYHLSQLPHRPLFPTQGTFISLTRKIEPDCITKWLWLLKHLFSSWHNSKTTPDEKSLSHMVLERSTTFWIYCTCENNKQLHFFLFLVIQTLTWGFKEWI